MEVKKIIETSELPLGEKVYLKKDWFGWRVVHPIRNEEGKINWFNLIFGSKSNLLFLLVIAILIIALYFGINQLIDNYKLVANNPCDFCTSCHAQCSKVIRDINPATISKLNFSELNFSIVN